MNRIQINKDQPFGKSAMKLFTQLTMYLVCFFTAISSQAGHHEKDIGASLNQKVDVSLDAVPESVISVIKEKSPQFAMREAEKELKHGDTYFDIEGIDGEGNEIEFDMLLDEDGSWRIVEIQRDLTLEQIPEPVSKLYSHRLGSVIPRRIIESDQGNGVIIYEFFSKKANKEYKHEIKMEVEFLEQEWKH